MPSLKCIFLITAGILALSARPTKADKLTITSAPPGATVELDGVKAGTTPFEKEYPGGYFHKTKTSLGARLGHKMVLRLSLKGYATKELVLTNGPMEWIAVNGRHHGEYWLFKGNQFHLDLQPISVVFTGDFAKGDSEATNRTRTPLSPEEFIKRTMPAVVYLKGAEKSGSGFFVTDTGVILTNAHLVLDEESLEVVTPAGQTYEGQVIYVDDQFDLALLKVESSAPGFRFPTLRLANTNDLHQGEPVFAIGNPGDGMQFSVTKGIVSAIGLSPSVGPGTWVQTDAQINHGNSGGPLLNAHGDVVGINTLKVFKGHVTGIGFALSSSDVLEVMHRFYPEDETAPEMLSSPSQPQITKEYRQEPEGRGIVVVREPEGASIFVDRQFVGSAPARIPLSAGHHLIVIRIPGRADYMGYISVVTGSEISLPPKTN
jgi:S1-C subfamily serine protease